MQINDDPEYLLTINNNMSVQQSNQQLQDSHVSNMVNELQNALNANDPNYTPVDTDDDDEDDFIDPRLASIQGFINKGK